MTLNELKPGSRCYVKRLAARDHLGQRLMDMGLCPGLYLRGDPLLSLFLQASPGWWQARPPQSEKI
jgi:ferrous iron transport protein A